MTGLRARHCDRTSARQAGYGNCVPFSKFRYFRANCEVRLKCGLASIVQSRQTCFNVHVLRKVAAIVGSAVFLVIAPGFVAGWVPWWVSRWKVQAPFFGITPLRIVGGLLIALGALGILDSFTRFAMQGLGTPAPVFPTRHLVVTGLYRYVRNRHCQVEAKLYDFSGTLDRRQDRKSTS
jgi:hypothetical protein